MAPPHGRASAASKVVTAVVVLGLALAAGVLAPAAHLPALAQDTVQDTAQDAGQDAGVCVGDRTGDQRQELNPDRPELAVVPDGTTDLVEVCAAADGSVSITTAAPTGLDDADPAWLHPGSAITVGLRTGEGGATDGPAEVVLIVGTAPDGAVTATAVDPAGSAVSAAGGADQGGDGCGVSLEEARITISSGCAPAGRVGAVQASLRQVADPLIEYSPVVTDRLPDGGGLAASTPERTPARLAGPDRITTAVAISAARFPQGATTAYLARADDLADAVAGGALTDGPVLLVPACGAVPAVVSAELDRLDPDAVVALGGAAAVCQATLDEAAADRRADRLAGPDRFSTAAEVAASAFPGGAEEVYLARGDDLADAVAAGSLPSGPVLLVPGGCGAVPDGVHLAVRRMLPSRVVALGGTAAVCEETLAVVAGGDEVDRDLGVIRLGGADRFATAHLIAERAFPGGAPTLFLARADDPADAVAGGSLDEGPTVLVPACGPVPPSTADAVDAVRPDRLVALGGPSAVCPTVLDAVGHLVARDR